MRKIQSSEIIEEDDKDQSINLEDQKVKIRRIISYQKSLHAPSPLVSSSVSSSSSSRSFSSSSIRSSNLLDLMKAGGMSLGRLFDMEHTSLATHMNQYSGSPVTRPIYLWGSDDDDVTTCSWTPVLESLRRSTVENLVVNEQISSVKEEVNVMESVRRLSRKKSYRKLPRFRMLKGRGGRLLFRLGRLKVLICGRR